MFVVFVCLFVLQTVSAALESLHPHCDSTQACHAMHSHSVAMGDGHWLHGGTVDGTVIVVRSPVTVCNRRSRRCDEQMCRCQPVQMSACAYGALREWLLAAVRRAHAVASSARRCCATSIGAQQNTTYNHTVCWRYNNRRSSLNNATPQPQL